jgi:transposase-like protein
MKYTPENCARIHALFAADDYTVEEVCGMIGINQDTFYEWKKTKPEFVALLKDADDRRLERFRVAARRGMIRLLECEELEETQVDYKSDKEGKPIIAKKRVTKRKSMPNAAAVIFASKNLDPENFKDTVEHTGAGGGPIKHLVGTIDFSKVPTEALKALLHARRTGSLEAGSAGGHSADAAEFE